MLTMDELIHMDQQELIRNVHVLSTWEGHQFVDPNLQDHDAIHNWIKRSGWQSPAYNEFHSMVARIRIADVEYARKKHGAGSTEERVAMGVLVNTLLARYGLTM